MPVEGTDQMLTSVSGSPGNVKHLAPFRET